VIEKRIATPYLCQSGYDMNRNYIHKTFSEDCFFVRDRYTTLPEDWSAATGITDRHDFHAPKIDCN
jgi:hypothetical protein